MADSSTPNDAAAPAPATASAAVAEPVAAASDAGNGNKRARTEDEEGGSNGNAAAGEAEAATAAESSAGATAAPASAEKSGRPANKRVKLDGKGNVLPHDYRQDHNRGANYDLQRADWATEGRDEHGKRLPKRKVAVFFGYCGIGYNGLQINPGVKTIEGDIFDAFCKVGAVSKDNAVNPAKVALQRSARTDRGVHAAGNILTLKLILDAPGVPAALAAAATASADENAEEKATTGSSSSSSSSAADSLVKAVNSMLPPIIRLWGITRVQGKFNARTSCDSRQYEYLLPTYVFLPPKPGTFMYGTLEKIRDACVAGGADPTQPVGPGLPSWTDVLSHPFWEAQGLDKQYGEDMVAKKKWRIPAAQLARVRETFQQYLGSHNFHNFTVGKEFRERSAVRFMKELTISEPKLINETEWVSIKIHGQSFMLHQIRKMVGLIVLIGRTATPASLVAETFGPARIHIPKAPGLGLLLEQPLFGSYNQKVQGANRRLAAVQARNTNRKQQQQGKAKKGGDDDDDDDDEDASWMREPVQFDKYTAEMEAFKQKYIYDRIMVVEEETAEFGKWLNYLDVFTGPDFDFLNPRGSIPTHCILRVGELRRLPGGQLKAADGTVTEAGAGGAGGADAGVDADAGGESDDEEMAGLNAAELEG
ncbi:tRNA pseudouridine synthase 1 [Tilletia horrida]|uniref:tRNA pseudouridine synthase 1 n=1 Tax=Tilletia horrida TaxID=155126 RepID=A0AAN6G7P3_9BASI|nr:tRNA pseudouridine synthase 1 [Tilletia horrida]